LKKRSGFWARFSPAERQAAILVGFLAIVVSILVYVASFGFETLSSVRAYVNGEGFWSKAQKTAVSHLIQFALTEDEAEYHEFLRALVVPIGDRQARLELEKPVPDMAVAMEGLRRGRNHPDDLERLAVFFRRFRDVSHVSRAIEIWEEGDREIERLILLSYRLRREVLAVSPRTNRIDDMLKEVRAIDERLTELEYAFSETLGDGARWAQGVLINLIGGAAAMLLVLSMLISQASARRINRSEASLRRSEEKQRTVLDTIEDGYYEIDLEGNFVAVNPALCRILGQTEKNLIGRSYRTFFDSNRTGNVDAACAAVRSTGDAVRAVLAEVIRGDSSVRTAEASVSLVRNVDGDPIGFCGVVRDITEQQQQEEALRQSEEQYRGVVEHARYGIFRATPAGRIVAVNPAMVTMLGYDSADELVDLDMAQDLFADASQRAAVLGAAADNGVIDDFEMEWKRKDGVPIVVRLNGRALHAEQGGFDGYEMFVDDLTHRRALETQLRQAQKMQAVGQLTGGIAHDFNNLLTIIASTADLLAKELPADAETAREDVDEMRHAAHRGADMIRKLLAFSRRGHLQFEVVNLEATVRDTTAMLRRILPAHINIELGTNGRPPRVRADPGALEQIMLNLATNARDAMPAGGTLTVEIHEVDLDEEFCNAHGGGRPGRYAALVVSDTGIGMDTKVRDRIFEPFFTTKPVGSGTGLGMSMIYGLVRQHDGFIDVDTEIDVGTTFSIFLPVSDEPETRDADAAGQAPRGGNELVLVVEDEPAILRTSRRILELYGYKVLTAANGEEALALLRKRAADIDLVLTDVVMPRLGGRGLYDAVRALGIPVRFLFMSGYTERDTGDILDPRLPLVRKPWTVEELLANVRDVLDEHETQVK
jgi:two-component system NtrC family sensor kinase